MPTPAVTLRTPRGFPVIADTHLDRAVRVGDRASGNATVFLVVNRSREDATLMDGDHVSLQASTGRFVSVKHDGRVADVSAPGRRETFVVEKAGSGAVTSGDRLSLRVWSGAYLGAIEEPMGRVEASAITIGSAQTFTLTTTTFVATGPEVQERWRNWSHDLDLTPARAFRPTCRERLIAIVRDAEARGAKIKATGGGWSFTPVAMVSPTDHFVFTDGLNRRLRNVIPSTLRQDIAVDAARARRFVHVEAGIKLRLLNCQLHDEELALPTAGGSAGQSIAGAISTGTHGGDIQEPPIADWVRAIHLVGASGREWWIEPSPEKAITDHAALRRVLPRDTAIRYDDDLFAAALVSLGRFGLIYVVVLEAADRFKLRETRVPAVWEEVRDQLWSDYLPDQSHFLRIVVNPFAEAGGQHACFITRRYKTEDDRPLTEDCEEAQRRLCHPGYHFESEPPHDLFSAICRPFRPAPAALALFEATLLGLNAATALIAPLLGPLAPIVAAGVAIGTIAIRPDVQRILLNSAQKNLGEVLAQICKLATERRMKHLVRGFLTAMLGSQQREQTRVGWSFQIMDRYTYDYECYKVDSTEFFFNCGRGERSWKEFVDDVCRIAEGLFDDGQVVPALMSLRFTRGSKALLAMSKYAYVCSIEIPVVKGFVGNEEFLRRVHAAAAARGGIPHWGQQHALTAERVRQLYGDRLDRWRLAAAEILDPPEKAYTFSSRFTWRLDLEPRPEVVIRRASARLGKGQPVLRRHYDGWRRNCSHIVAGNFGGDALTELLFYDPTQGEAEVHEVDVTGALRPLRTHTGWGQRWSAIIPGDFGGDGYTDLLFYSMQLGVAEIYTLQRDGRLARVRAHEWRRTWAVIVAGDFAGNGWTDLLLYDPTSGEAEIHTTDGAGRLSLVRSYNRWRRDWSQIVPGQFGGGSRRTDLFFYNQRGEAELYTMDLDGRLIELSRVSGLSRGVSAIVPGAFGGDTHTDLLLYSAEHGAMEIHTTDERGQLRLLAAHNGWRRRARPLGLSITARPLSDVLIYDPGQGQADLYAIQ